MQDKIYLLVDNKKIENFLSYSVDADIYLADDAFSLELANPEIKIKTGLRCELYINDQLELTGIIDKVSAAYDKSGRKLRAEGRDLMGILTDSYCEEFSTFEGATLKSLAEKLLKKTPFINTKNIVYQKNVVGRLKSSDSSGLAAFGFSQIEPGMTIAEALREYALSRGVMFWSMPDGTFIFGRPMVSGEPVFNLVNRKNNSAENNILSGEMTEDISKKYSKITVIGQQQGTDSTSAALINTKASLENAEWPFYDENSKLRFYKPYVAKNNNDYQSPKAHGRILLEKMKHEGFQLKYVVPGHSQNGNNWSINQICFVADETFGLETNFLVYGRTFELSKDKGTTTTLRLGFPGVIQ